MSITGITDVLRRPRVASATSHTPGHPNIQASDIPGLAPGKGREGKRSDPDFERLTVYVRSNTRIAARRKAEDAAGGRKVDESELIQRLLSEYAGAK